METEVPSARKRKIPKWPFIVGALLVTAGAAAYYVSRHFGPIVREHVVELLRERYQSAVELKKLEIVLFPQVHAVGEGLVLHLHGRTDLPPLVSVQKFTVSADLKDLLSGPRRVRKLRLEGLKITVTRGASKPAEKKPAEKTAQAAPPSWFVIDEVNADGTVLTVIPKKEGKDPLVFELHKLTLHSAGLGQPMTYRTTMTNAKPPGLIEASGGFGPWQADEPVETPVSGDYTFQNADLSDFEGIAGILSSQGKFRGSLGHIETDGTTDTPDFRLSISGHPVDLKTEFHSIVDGSDGDTLLQPVKARFLRTPIVARGGVTGTKGVPGKTIALDLTITRGRLEDLLRLALKSDKPFIIGALDFRTSFLLPPGKGEIEEKLKLKGQFRVSDARFTNTGIQGKIENLSFRARGRPEETDEGGEVVSNLKGKFTLDRGVMTFSELSFGVPGALIQLTGSYGLEDEVIDFHGNARMDAKLSQMTTGFKSILLKAVDPFFKKDGAGAVLPIKITGTRDHPDFGLELRRKDK